ncbi:putative LRR receptor-like serine/threonine-protein kinase [Morus notabilis]|uniref:Putative LRR receptor-like serine/threonine-protein kinase n=1 Tax=Morus notabilis TaxID=981085 RepID=W9SL06_9ROSA|nr:putative LRR receptor-like serine/threonine-protein kinase [Morus notabilis]
MESNLFNGNVPSELGKLVNVERLILGAYNLTGQFPLALTNLSKLNELISSNNFTGRMPDFGGWKQLQKLEMQASGFEGSIPSSLSLLSNLTELDLSFNKLEGEIPDFENIMRLDTL